MTCDGITMTLVDFEKALNKEPNKVKKMVMMKKGRTVVSIHCISSESE